MKVAVENPEAWKSELENLKSFLLEMIDDPGKVVIEPKMSMLSIRLAEKGGYLLKAMDGKEVNERWVGEQIQRYFELTENHLDGRLSDLMEEINCELPQLADYTVKAVNACRNDGEGRGLNGRKKKVLEGLKEVMALIEDSHQRRIAEIESRTLVIDRMYKKGELIAKYNPTAGYVDIGHRDVNKFSTLMKYVIGTQNITPDEVLFVQIGDSTTDILPTEKTGAGEPNEGADEAFLIAVNNCNEKMQTAVEDRDQYGLYTRNQAVLGVEAMFKGLRALVSRGV